MKKILFILIAVAAACVFQIAGFQTIANAAWGEDVLVTNYIPDYSSVKPSMDEAPNGDLYIVVEENPWMRVYKSTDGGETWEWLMQFASGNISNVNPSLAYAAGSEDWVFITWEVIELDDSRSILLYRFDPTNHNSSWADIASGIYMPPDLHIQPEICTDTPYYYATYYVYVTYSVEGTYLLPGLFFPKH